MSAGNLKADLKQMDPNETLFDANLATDPHANDNEARSAAMEVCRRLARK